MQFIPFTAVTNTTTADDTSTTEVLNQARPYTYCEQSRYPRSFSITLKKYVCRKSKLLLLLQEKSIVNYAALSAIIDVIIIIVIIIIIINSRRLGVVRIP